MTPGNGAYTRWWYCLMPGWRWSSCLMVLPWYYLIPDLSPNYHKIAPGAPGCAPAPPCQLGAKPQFVNFMHFWLHLQSPFYTFDFSSKFHISHSWHLYLVLLFGLFDREAGQICFSQKGRCPKPNTCILTDWEIPWRVAQYQASKIAKYLNRAGCQIGGKYRKSCSS